MKSYVIRFSSSVQYLGFLSALQAVQLRKATSSLPTRALGYMYNIALEVKSHYRLGIPHPSPLPLYLRHNIIFGANRHSLAIHPHPATARFCGGIIPPQTSLLRMGTSTMALKILLTSSVSAVRPRRN
jgi:hypothetical protein